jgi:CheY-like chemotaxis protein
MALQASFKEFLDSYQERARLFGFHRLMQKRVREILLLSSPYDSFVLAEDGRLQDMLLSEYQEHNLHYAPGITHVSSAAEALVHARDANRFNLIVTTMHVDDMPVAEFARKVRAEGIGTPLILLTYDNRELAALLRRNEEMLFDRIFNWQGDFRIFLTIVKHIEDMMNVDHDHALSGVQVVILVEDSIRYYSTYLPMFYGELFKQSQRLIAEWPSVSQKLLRMRARPKILLATDYEWALEYFNTYSKDVLGIVSDIKFPRGGELDPRAGLELARHVREVRDDIPVLLQSSNPENMSLAGEVGAAFIWKDSPTLMEDLRGFMLSHFSFGDFVFRMPDGTEVARANDMKSLEDALRTVPIESLIYHASRNHFSNWLKARTEFLLAESLRPRKISDFKSLEDVRNSLVSALHEVRMKRYLGNVVDFNPGDLETSTNIARIGTGSIGGKARGLAFVSMLLNRYGIRDHFPGVKIFVPGSVVLCTDVFTQFMEENNLARFALECGSDTEIIRVFTGARLPEDITRQLRQFLSNINYPLAVRSSSILEDSLYQPFAGVYETYMVPNNDPDPEERLRELTYAIKAVYASTFSRSAKDYVRATNYRLEEEKMAVIVQRVIGNRHGCRFYPHLAGVARSHNSYPLPPMEAGDGVVSMALGLGQAVVDGTVSMSYCPSFPRQIMGWSDPADYLKYSQREFFALDLGHDCRHGGTPGENFRLSSYGLDVAEDDGMLAYTASTYSVENNALFDGISRSGPRVISFAPLLKSRDFPVSEILEIVMDMGRWGMNQPVEIEFAANIAPQTGGPKEFAVVQMRPLVLHAEASDIEVDGIDDSLLVCRSPKVLGNGRMDGIRDLVVVDREKFTRAKSVAVAAEVAAFNRRLADEGRAYILIGMGRWGSADPWLGIPVQWGSISGARVIVEAGFKDFRVQPSQGSHFFQNLTSFMTGYFTINEEAGEGFVDWAWLMSREPAAAGEFTRLLRFDRPMHARLNGRTGQGAVFKPGEG